MITLDLAAAADLIANLMATIQSRRDDEEFIGKVFDNAAKLYQTCAIEPIFQKRRACRPPGRLAESVVEETTGYRPEVGN